MGDPLYQFCAILGVACLLLLGFLAVTVVWGWFAKALGFFQEQRKVAQRANTYREKVERLETQVAILRDALAATIQGQPSAPVSNPSSDRYCPRCGTQARYVAWSAKGERKAGHAWHCDHCQQWLYSKKKGGD